MSDLSATPIGLLEARGLVLNPVWKGATSKPGRFGYRGELAIKLAESTAGEKRPPVMKAEQVFMVTEGDRIVFFAGFVHSLAHLAAMESVLEEFLTPTGHYYCFAGNVDLLKKYKLEVGGTAWLVLPLDESTVYNELLELFMIEKGDLKKLDMGGKNEAIAASAAGFTPGRFTATTYEAACAEMGPVKVYENRPV